MPAVSDLLTELQQKYETPQPALPRWQRIHSTLDPQQALQLILREAVRLMHATSGSAVLINPTNGFLEIQRRKAGRVLYDGMRQVIFWLYIAPRHSVSAPSPLPSPFRPPRELRWHCRPSASPRARSCDRPPAAKVGLIRPIGSTSGRRQ